MHVLGHLVRVRDRVRVRVGVRVRVRVRVIATNPDYCRMQGASLAVLCA